MARQRFIWPQMWEDPDLASLTTGAHLLYIACFSLADDEGRLDGNPVYLRNQAFTYRRVSQKAVRTWTKELVDNCSAFHMYDVNGRQYIQFLNWHDFQKPKYPSPSKLPPPPDHSPNDSGKWSRKTSPKPSGNDSTTGWDGLGLPPSPPQPDAARSPNGGGAGLRKRKTKTTPEHFARTVGAHYADQDLRDELQERWPHLNDLDLQRLTNLARGAA